MMAPEEPGKEYINCEYFGSFKSKYLLICYIRPLNCILLPIAMQVIQVFRRHTKQPAAAFLACKTNLNDGSREVLKFLVWLCPPKTLETPGLAG